MMLIPLSIKLILVWGDARSATENVMFSRIDETKVPQVLLKSR